MKNITLKVDASVLERVRRYALERRSSVNALVREYLGALAEKEDRARNARQRLLALSRRSRAKLGPRTWTRDELHER
jgi:hypothetical protein